METMQEDYKGLAKFANRIERKVEDKILEGAELDLHGELDKQVTKLLVDLYDAARALRLYCESKK